MTFDTVRCMLFAMSKLYNKELPFKEEEIICLQVEAPKTSYLYSTENLESTKISFVVEKIKKDIAAGDFKVKLICITEHPVLTGSFEYVYKVRFSSKDYRGVIDCQPNWNRNLPSVAYLVSLVP